MCVSPNRIILPQGMYRSMPGGFSQRPLLRGAIKPDGRSSGKAYLRVRARRGPEDLWHVMQHPAQGVKNFPKGVENFPQVLHSSAQVLRPFSLIFFMFFSRKRRPKAVLGVSKISLVHRFCRSVCRLEMELRPKQAK